MDFRHPVDITTTAQWEALTALPRPAHLRELFAADPGRAERYLITVGDLRIDYSKQPIDDAVLGVEQQRYFALMAPISSSTSFAALKASSPAGMPQ